MNTTGGGYDYFNRTSNEETSIAFLSTNTTHFNWNTTSQFLINISESYFDQMNIQVGKSLNDSISLAANAYVYSPESTEIMSTKFTSLVNKKFQEEHLPTLLFDQRIVWTDLFLDKPVIPHDFSKP